MGLKIYNTLKREKEDFIPQNPPYVGMYVCGPTVYGNSHLGHARSYTSFDVIYRYLKYCGYKVRYVQNITDVGHLVGDADEGEGKISRQAALEKQEPVEIAYKYAKIEHPAAGYKLSCYRTYNRNYLSCSGID